MSLARVVCRSCDAELFTLAQLCLLRNDSTLYIRPEVASRPSATTSSGLSQRTGRAENLPGRFCRKCDSKVGRTQPDAISDAVYEALKAEAVTVICPDGTKHEVNDWAALQAVLEDHGVKTLTKREFLIQSGAPNLAPAREGAPQLATVLVDQDGTSSDTLQSLTSTEMRNYQLEMVQFSLEQNSLVCLPAGAGKTLVAAAVLRAMLHLNPQKIAVFVVPTNPLVEQQSYALEKEIPSLKIITVSGQMDPEQKMKNIKLINKFKFDILVCTCACVNRLLDIEALRVSDLCCLVLDEAHQTKGKSEYSTLVSAVHSAKGPQFLKPLMLGLTASPLESVKMSDSESDLLEGVTEIAERLQCHPCFPSKENDPYSNGMTHTQDIALPVEASGSERDFRQELDRYIKLVVGSVKQHLGIVASFFDSLENKLNENTLDTNAFRGIIRKTADKLHAKRDEAHLTQEDAASVYYGYAVVDHLYQILTVHEINDIIGHQVAKDRLKKIFEEVEDPVAGQESRKKEILYNLQRDFTGMALYADLFAKLKRECRSFVYSEDLLSEKCRTVLRKIKDHYADHRNESRILVFVLMRRTAKTLKECFSRMDVIRTELNPQVIVGRGIRGDGLTIEEQQEILNDFRRGRSRLLITTSILEEGLDVPTCNMVLRMKAPENLREFVQSRGRACRAADGKFTIICCNNEEAKKQQRFLTCMEVQTKVIREMMDEPDFTLGALHEHDRAILDLTADSGRAVHGAGEAVDAEDNEELDAERLAEMFKIINQVDTEPDQRFQEDFDREVVELNVRFAFFCDDKDSYINAVQAFKEDFSLVYSDAEMRNWNDTIFPAENQLGTQFYPEATIVGLKTGGAEEFQSFEKEMLELFMSDIFRDTDCSFWMSPRSARSYFPRSTSLRISLHRVSLGSLKTPHDYVQRHVLGKASHLRIERGSERIVLTVDDRFQVEATFANLQDFVLVDRHDSGDEAPLVYLYLTFSRTPRLSRIQSQSEEQRMQMMRAVEYGEGTRQVFARCHTYKLEIPNKPDGARRCALGSRIRQVLRLLESAGVTVYYTSVKEDIPRQPFLPEESAFDPELTPHRGNKRVSYAMMCLRSAPGFVQDRLGPEFYQCLGRLSSAEAERGLYGLTKLMTRNLFCDPVKGLQLESKKGTLEEKSQPITDHAFIKRAAITPTGVHYFEPELVQTNRVVRRHSADSFLRVHIRDEDDDNLTSLHGQLSDVMGRILGVLRRGLTLDEARYEYLAASNSQIRGHSCYFIEDSEQGIAESIRCRIGDLTAITNVASYASRLGLALSTSNRTINVYAYYIESDLENERYTFSDGVGLIAEPLAKKVQAKLKLDTLPSAFQIRLGGCKGVLSVWKESLFQHHKYPTEVVVRESMWKYPSDDTGLEVLDFARPLPLHLNQQVIMLLSNLGVGAEKFMDLLRSEIADMGKMFVEERAAEAVLLMVDKDKVEPLRRVRFRFTSEPYFRHIMMAVYKRRMKDLRERSRVRLDEASSRVLMGIMDETETLQYGEVFIQISAELGRQTNPTKRVITSEVVILKNPCLHPGDARKFKGRDVPELRHLVDCVVFPANGDRPHPNELSGSDLDGDMYHCIWDDRLMPTLDIKEAMDYSGGEKEVEPDAITVGRVLDHMCAYIEKDTLGMIDNTHKALADQMGIESDECLELAKVHALAVDAPKTGNWQEIDPEIKALLKKYPDFMMKTDKPSYPSANVLGEMFRECSKYMSDTSAPSELTEISCPRPERAFEFPGYEAYLPEAKTHFAEYNQHLSGIMKLYGIETEAELLSGFISTVHSRLKEEMDDIEKCVRQLLRDLCNQFKVKFYRDPRLQEGDLRQEERKKKAAAWYYVAYSSRYGQSYTAYKETRRFLSFPWMVSDVLAEIYSSNAAKSHGAVRSLNTQISDSVKDIFDGSVDDLNKTFRQHADLVETIAGACHRFDFMLFGLSSLMLFDEEEGKVSILVFKARRSRRNANRNDQLDLLNHVRNDARSLFVYSDVDNDQRRLDVRVNRRLPKRKARLTADMRAVNRWIVIKKYFFKRSWLYPVLRVLCSWMAVSGLVGGHVHFLPDELVPLLFIDHCLKNKEFSAIPFSQCEDAAEEFLQYPTEAAPFGTEEEWDRLLNGLRQKDPSIPWEGSNSGKVGRLLCSFMESGKTITDSDIHPELAQVFGIKKWSEVVVPGKMKLLVSEMEKASHRLSLHVNASVLLAKVQVERPFSIDISAAKGLAGDEEGLTRMLHRQSGARVDIQTRMGRKSPGMIVKGVGTEAELYLLGEVVKFINARAKEAERTNRAVRVRGYKDATGAHNLMVEGATPEHNLIALEPYLGFKHPQHAHKSLYVIRLASRSRQATTDPVSTDVYDDFRKHFKHQMAYFDRHYSEEVCGPTELQVKFGRTYVINPPDSFVEDSSYLTTAELTKALERRKLRVTDPLFDSGKYRPRSHHADPSAGGGNISTSFISAIVLDEPGKECLIQRVRNGNGGGESPGAVLLDQGVKLVAETGTGMITAKYDKDLKFSCIETSPLRWIVSDLKRTCQVLKDSVEGRETDIRVMMKSQHSEKDQLEDHALAADFQGAVARRRDNNRLYITKEDLHVEYMEDYQVYSYAMKLRFGIPCQMIVRNATHYSRRFGQDFSSVDEVDEIRLVPDLKAFMDSTTVDSALDALWSEAFAVSDGLNCRTN